MSSLLSLARHYLTASRGGHGIHSPFAYRLCEEVFYNETRFYDFDRLDSVRQDLLGDDSVLEIHDLGAGSKKHSSNRRTVKDIARTSLSTRRRSETLYRLVHFLNATDILEIGTSLGLNALYLAAATHTGKVNTLEGSPALCEFASRLADVNGASNFTVHCGAFDSVLKDVIGLLKKIDLAYIDGNHTLEATLHYFGQCLAVKHDSTVFVIDDINWSDGMREAWIEITRHPQVTLTIDTWFSGYVFFRKDVMEKQHLKLWTGR